MPVEHACSMQGICTSQSLLSRPPLHIDSQRGWVEAEGHCTGAALIAATRLFQLMPAVLPMCGTQVVADAMNEAGVGPSAFRFGRFADTVMAHDVQPTVPARPGAELRVRLRTAAFQPFVRIEHRRRAGIDELLSDMEQQCNGDADFIDAVASSSRALVLSVARMTSRAPWLGDRRNLRPDFAHAAPLLDYQETTDFVWRFDRRHLRQVTGDRVSVRGADRLFSRLSLWYGNVRPSWCEACVPIGEAEGLLGELLGSPGQGPVSIHPLRRQASDELLVTLGFWHRASDRPAPAPRGSRVIEPDAALESQSC